MALTAPPVKEERLVFLPALFPLLPRLSGKCPRLQLPSVWGHGTAPSPSLGQQRAERGAGQGGSAVDCPGHPKLPCCQAGEPGRKKGRKSPKTQHQIRGCREARAQSLVKTSVAVPAPSWARRCSTMHGTDAGPEGQVQQGDRQRKQECHKNWSRKGG